MHPKTIDLNMRLWGITTEFVGFIPWSLVLRSIILGRFLIYRNWSIYCWGYPSSGLTSHQRGVENLLVALC